MAPTVLQASEEFRKQAPDFMHVLARTIQECNAGHLLQEDTTKNFISGDRPPARENYGVKTTCATYNRMGKWWEINMELPSISGNPAEVKSLKPKVRRLNFIELETTVDVENKVLLENPELSPILAGLRPDNN